MAFVVFLWGWKSGKPLLFLGFAGVKRLILPWRGPGQPDFFARRTLGRQAGLRPNHVLRLECPASQDLRNFPLLLGLTRIARGLAWFFLPRLKQPS